MFFNPKKTFLFAWFLSALLSANAQVDNGPKIEYPKFQDAVLKPAHPKAGTEATLIIKGAIAPEWHVYGTDQGLEVLIIPAELLLDNSASFKVLGRPKSIGTHAYDDQFMGKGINQWSTKNPLEIRQKIKVLKDDPSVRGVLKYQTCAEVCVMGKFKINIKGIDKASANQTVDSNTGIGNATDTAAIPKSNSGSNTELKTPESQSTSAANDPNTNESIWGLILLSFLAGLSALITPCVFPMIPMTVAYFCKNTKEEGGRRRGIINGIIFGVSIILIYTIPGTLVAKVAGPAFANWLSTHWVPNMIFFGLFVIFAASFLGMFEIVLPAGFVNKIDKKGDKNSYLGIFFMAFTLVLVSFSCTGPIVSSVFAQTLNGEVARPFFSMLAFSTAIALPFSIFAIFPGLMQSLPKGGGWLNSVKVSLGFIELAAALKFLSIPDQTYHWGLLDREIYLAFWIVIFSLWGFYLLGKLKFSHDSDLPYLGVPRLMMAIVVFTFVVYMIPGMWGAPLKGLAGYIPPMESQDFILSEGGGNLNEANTSFPNSVKYDKIYHMPHRIKGFFDFKEASAYAKKVNKPIFIDFTGLSCTNCREMEANVWSDPEVMQRLKNDYVVVALYADDKITTMPQSSWYTSKIDGEIKKTVGDQNLDWQFTEYGGLAQPQYVLVDDAGNRLLNYDKYYDPAVPNFVKFLDEGKEKFDQKKGKVGIK